MAKTLEHYPQGYVDLSHLTPSLENFKFEIKGDVWFKKMPPFDPVGWSIVANDIFAPIIYVPTLNHEVDIVFGSARRLPKTLSIEDRAALIEAREHINNALEETI